MGRLRHGFHLLAAASCLALLSGGALAQMLPQQQAQRPRTSAGSVQLPSVGGAQVSRDQPVAFTADSVTYDRDHQLIVASGHVEAWQGDTVLRADRITFDRTTNLAAAAGNVTLIEPNGQVLYADYAELDQGFRDGVLKAMRARLAENGRLAANGVRRSGGKINEMSRVVYTTCNDCKNHPERAPLWQLRAYSGTQDTEHERIEFRDAELDMFGIPVLYTPYMWTTDPSAKRGSGFLVPSIGSASHLGFFYAQPYYWVIDGSSDLVVTPEFTAAKGPQISGEYRQVFNDGHMRIEGSMANDRHEFQGNIDANGEFVYNDDWRYGFDVNRATSVDYVRDFHIPGLGASLLSQVYAEGFGQGSYARIDARSYQGLTSNVDQSTLPNVLPRGQYDYFGEVDGLGGRTSLEAGAFQVLRGIGTGTQRGDLVLDWQRPFLGRFGELYNLILHDESAGYSAQRIDEQPNFATDGHDATTARSQPTAAVNIRWPFARSGGFGTQVIEPIVQFVGGPNTGYNSQRLIPNEDSLDTEFSDANLFSLNRFPGIDRQEGGARMAVALHASWFNAMGQGVDALIGQSYRAHKDDTFPVGSGLEGQVSDIVARASWTPASWFDLTGRTRIDHSTLGLAMADVVATTGPQWLKLSAGYLQSKYDPFYMYDTAAAVNANAIPLAPRNEITLGVNTHSDAWRFSANARRDVVTGKMVSAGVAAAYEDECFIFEAKFDRRFTSFAGDNGDSILLFQVTFKTVGQFGWHAS